MLTGSRVWRTTLLLLAGVNLALTPPAAARPAPDQASLRDACDRHENWVRLDSAGVGATAAARAVWISGGVIKWPGMRANSGDRFRLYHSVSGRLAVQPGQRVVNADGTRDLKPMTDHPAREVAARFDYLGAGFYLSTNGATDEALRALHQQQALLTREDSNGIVIDATALQLAAALDDLYASAYDSRLGVSVGNGGTGFSIWAPTAKTVSLCLYRTPTGGVQRVERMQRDPSTGVWNAAIVRDLRRWYYTYLVDVFVPGIGLVRNRVTDPYSVSLTTDSRRSYVAELRDRSLKPQGWDVTPLPARVSAQTDMVIYELHVRDFSIDDSTVPLADRGKFRAFAQPRSNGMRHLKRLAAAGLTDVHLLPVFDLATIPERGCVTPAGSAFRQGPDSDGPQAAITAAKDRDCFNWGYDPLHFTAPEGSYATDAQDGARRIIELREMVLALHRAGLRVGMDVVYNHTAASGQQDKSVLDRIVPGYYHRLNADGLVERSTCCDNTATEHRMMARLMIDSVLTWAREYRIDSFRFDLMAHQPRSVMLELKRRLKSETGRDIQLIGEGWNFGEVANGARFVQASQLSLNGTGIGTFSDRARDAVRGGGPSDSGQRLIAATGFLGATACGDDPARSSEPECAGMLATADMVRVGLAGSIRDYPLQTFRNERQLLREIDYNGQPAGYVSEPAEVVNYVENHDNQTLFDINVFKLPASTSREDRARVQIVAAAVNMFSQGIAYFHAGIEMLRSKSLDRNSFDSGDWFNRLDWTFRDNYFAVGMPPAQDNAADYPLIKPLLANPAIKPTPKDIAWTRDAFVDLLRIRDSSTLFRLRTAGDIMARLQFHNTGSSQVPGVIAAQISGKDYPGARFAELIYFLNAGPVEREIVIPSLAGAAFRLHPVHISAGAADRRIASRATYERTRGVFRVPARSAVVFVQY